LPGGKAGLARFKALALAGGFAAPKVVFVWDLSQPLAAAPSARLPSGDREMSALALKPSVQLCE